MFVIDRASMRFVDCNDTACRLLGYTHSEFLGLDPSDMDVTIGNQTKQECDHAITTRSTVIKESVARCKDGTSLPVEMQLQAFFLNGRWNLLLSMRDGKMRRNAESDSHDSAYYDPLTGLPNRQMFYQSLDSALAQAKKQGLTISLLFINVDKFRQVNDALGYAQADQLLKQIGSRLVNRLRIRDVVGHLGGDEFGLILFNSAGSQGAAIVANKVLQELNRPFYLSSKEATITTSIGISTYPVDTNDAATIIKYADSAMNEAKREGGNTFRYYTAEMNTRMLEKRELHHALNSAIANNEFVLHYQPKIHIETGDWTGVEALIRWNRPEHGLVSPGLFIAALEETDMISAVGEWVIRSVCRQIAEWNNSGIGPIRIAMNLSAKQFQQDGLITAFVEAIQENRIEPTLLEIEITESLLMSDVDRASFVLAELSRLGIHIAIDDFGTGFSSLSYLQKFPVDKLKIDMVFIRNVTTNENDAAITSAIIGMAHSMKLEVIAEGVETIEQLEFLRQHRCDQFQGYYFSRPLPVDELDKLWRKSTASTE
jgi:diguanylate cyclase (GGDEF)-like protein/PAS domain S-box-containing protein